MKRAYIEKNFAAKTMEIITAACVIVEDYKKQGFELTLRQLYYQFVARGLLANTEKNYKMLGEVVSNARLAGLIDWDAITDRTRHCRINPHWDSPAQIVRSAVYGYRIDKWATQPHGVEVWIEKDALVDVIGGVCSRLDVPYFSCRGYVSQSEMYSATMRLIQYAKPVTVLHLGDHDPSGIDMTRDVQDRITLLSSIPPDCTCPPRGSEDFRCDHCEQWSVPDIQVKRIALTMEQIREKNPPPNPAKLTDSRCADYMTRYGRESWELDALDPAYLSALVEHHITDIRDDDAWTQAVERENRERKRLEEAAKGLEV